jgi:magnesium transporter
MDQELVDSKETIAMSGTPADAFVDLPEQRWRDMFFSLSESVQERLVADMAQTEIEEFVDYLDPDEVTDVLGYVDEETREVVLGTLEDDRREKIEFLLSFDPGSAAGLMTLDFVTVDESWDPSRITERLRQFETRTGRVPILLVTDDSGAVVGELPGGALSVADTVEQSILDYVKDVPQIRYDSDDEAVLELAQVNRDSNIVVVDDDDVLGVIRANDLLALVEETRGETLYEFTGVDEEESVLDSPLAKVQSRYKWLILNLGTAFLAAAVVGLFESTITAVAILAAYMPVVAGMGGNAGTQAMAVTVRGISLGQVSLETGKRVVANEALAGALNGAVTGVLVAVIATAFSFGTYGVFLGGVIGVSMVANLIIAGFFGALTPLLLDKVGYDPATSATIFITTATDVLGFFVFLGLAQVVLL